MCIAVAVESPVVSDSLQSHGLSMPGFSVPHHLPKFAQVHVHCISDAIRPSHSLTPSSPSVLSLSQHQGLFQWHKPGASLVAQLVKNLPAMQETWVRSLGWEDPLEKGTAGYPLQYSSLENSMDRGVWQAIAHVHYYKRPDRDLPHLCLEYRMPKKNTVYQIFFSFFLLFKNWGLVASECCVSFCGTAKWVSYIYMCVYTHTYTHILLEYKHMRVGNFVCILFTTVAPTPKIELST